MCQASRQTITTETNIATAVVLSNVKSRISALELATTKVGIRLAGEAFDNYHDYIGNQVAGFRWDLTQAGVNFPIDPNLKGPFSYEIAINEDGPTISSSQLPVYRPE